MGKKDANYRQTVQLDHNHDVKPEATLPQTTSDTQTTHYPARNNQAAPGFLSVDSACQHISLQIRTSMQH